MKNGNFGEIYVYLPAHSTMLADFDWAMAAKYAVYRRPFNQLNPLVK
jgi:hypothetical protein